MLRKMLILICVVSILVGGDSTNAFAKKKQKHFSLNQGKRVMKVGESTKLKIRKKGKLRVRKKTFVSLNKKVATVTKAGKIKAKRPGKATIRVRIKYNSKRSKKIKRKTLLCKITVSGNTKSSNNTQKPSATNAPVVTREPGLYNSEGSMLKTWAQLLEEATDGKEKRVVVNNILEETVLEKCDNDMEGVLVISKDISSIGESALRGCTGLTEIEISGNVSEIGASAFAGCKKLNRINIPDSVKRIGRRAFYGCSSLLRLDVPSGVESIGIQAFYAVPLVAYKGDATGSPWGADEIYF